MGIREGSLQVVIETGGQRVGRMVLDSPDMAVKRRMVEYCFQEKIEEIPRNVRD